MDRNSVVLNLLFNLMLVLFKLLLDGFVVSLICFVLFPACVHDTKLFVFVLIVDFMWV